METVIIYVIGILFGMGCFYVARLTERRRYSKKASEERELRALLDKLQEHQFLFLEELQKIEKVVTELAEAKVEISQYEQNIEATTETVRAIIAEINKSGSEPNYSDKVLEGVIRKQM